MIKNIKKFFNITATLVMGSLILWNCESDADQLGSQFFQNGAEGTEQAFPLIAYNVLNGDSIRVDNARLQQATLGAFKESQFGLQKSDYVSQMRLSVFAPEFGTNPILDSAVMVLTPYYAADSVAVTTTEDYIYPIGAVPAKKVVSTYPVYKYGKTKIGTKTVLNIKVNEVTEFLGGNSVDLRSNKNVTTGQLIGSKAFNGDISSIKVTKDADNSVVYERLPTLRIPMDSTFFQTKILAKANSPELGDVASFIRYIKGVKISVAENDGFIFNFDPNSVVINLYYKKDKVDGTTTTREDGNFSIDLGNQNTHFNQITFDRTGTPSATAGTDDINGVPKLYAQGMGGPGMGFKIPAATVATVKDMFKNDKIGIVSAKLRIYTDAATWNNNYKKPNYFTVKEKDLNTFLVDMQDLATTGVYRLIKSYDVTKNPAYYDIGITQTFKNIIEKEATSRDFILNIGDYTVDPITSKLNGDLQVYGTANTQQLFNTRSYTPTRAVFVGTDPTNEKSAKLMIIYGKK